MEKWETEMDIIRVEKVILSTLRRRGAGKEGDPIRIITEVYTLDGELIAEYDPINEILEQHENNSRKND